MLLQGEMRADHPSSPVEPGQTSNSRTPSYVRAFPEPGHDGGRKAGPKPSRDRVELGPNATALSYLRRDMCGHISRFRSGLSRQALRMQLRRGELGLAEDGLQQPIAGGVGHRGLSWHWSVRRARISMVLGHLSAGDVVRARPCCRAVRRATRSVLSPLSIRLTAPGG